jgi:hypothetical protein
LALESLTFGIAKRDFGIVFELVFLEWN